MWSWQTAVPLCPPCGIPLITSAHVPQIPSRQSESNAIGASPRLMRSSLTTSSISRNDMSGLTFFAWYWTKRPGVFEFFCRQTFKVRFIRVKFLLVAPLGHAHFFIDQRLLVQCRRPVGSLILPGRHKGEVLIISKRLAFLG